MSEEKELKGVAGWLSLFRINILFLLFSQLITFIFLPVIDPEVALWLKEFRFLLPYVSFYSIILFIGFQSVRLMKARSKGFVKCALIYIWIYPAVILWSLEIELFFISSFAPIIWTLYLLKSRRVKNTFVQ